MSTFPRSDVSLEYKFHVKVEASINSKPVISQNFLSRQKKDPSNRNTAVRDFCFATGRPFIIKSHSTFDFGFLGIL
jgi:hypothetical protein